MTTAIDDELWSAVGDPSRRQLLGLLLTKRALTATALSAELPISRQAVAKHLAVLDSVGLVHGASSGREKRYEIDEEQFARATAQLLAVGNAWDNRLRRIEQIAKAIEQRKTPTPEQP